MTATIPNLWPDDIKVDLLPPVTILRVQAGQLSRLTGGILDADVTTVTGDKDFVVHRLDVVASALAGRRYRVLTATHRADYYPVVLEAECFRPKTRTTKYNPFESPGGIVTTRTENLTWPDATDWRPAPANQDEFIERVREVLRSKEVRAVIESLIVLSNERSLQADDANPDEPAEPAA